MDRRASSSIPDPWAQTPHAPPLSLPVMVLDIKIGSFRHRSREWCKRKSGVDVAFYCWSRSACYKSVLEALYTHPIIQPVYMEIKNNSLTKTTSMTSVAAVLSLEKLYCKSPATFKHLQVGRRNKIHTAPLCFTGRRPAVLLLRCCWKIVE